MIDTDLLVYAGTLAIFILATLIIGILCLVFFTALATIASIKKARRNHHAGHDYAAVQCPELLDAEHRHETWEETPVSAADEPAGTGHDPAGRKRFGLRRRKQPRIIQHV